MRGEYGLEVYGNDPNKDGDTYTHICQYFMHYASPEEENRAFYQETPDRAQMLAANPATSNMDSGYQPGVQQVSGQSPR